MIWASFDVDLPDDDDFIALEQENPAWPWWWMRLLQFAKRSNQKGLVLKADGRPVTALSLAMTHHRDRRKQEAWQEFLDFACDLGLLAEEEGCLRIVDWRRWHRSPSDEPEAVRERVARHRAEKSKRDKRDKRDVTDVTKGNACNDTEQSIAIAEHPPQETLQQDQGGGMALNNGSLKAAAEQVLMVISPGGLSSSLRQKLSQFLAIDTYTGRQKLEALQVGLSEVKLELETVGGTRIRAPDHLVVKRAQLALGRPAPANEEMFF